jgi:thiamine-phosphate diphosphorylase
MAPMTKTNREKLKGLYFILNLGPGGFSDVPIWLEGVIANGARIIQVRAKEIHPVKLVSIAREVIRLADRYEASVIVNDFPEVARDSGAFGVHLGVRDFSIPKAKHIIGRDAVVGATVRNVNQAGRAIGAGADYVAVGSVFKSPTKPSTPVVGLDTLEIVRDQFPDVPMCAIGGINLGNILSVIETGADMAAVVSAIAGADNPEKAAFALSTVFASRFPSAEEEDLDEFGSDDVED